MATVLEQYGLTPVSPITPVGLNKWVSEQITVGSNELIGIEVEVENYSPRDSNLNKAWRITTDGSLRNQGAELITKPFPASYAPAMLAYLFNQHLNTDCCFGPRTSIHVHLNVQDLTRTQVQDYILMYSVYERLFYKFAGRGRQKNVYCVPLFDCDLLVNMVDYGETRDRQWSKYTGLNTLPIMEYGTVEFRHMHGTTDVAKLATWINLICKLKEYVKTVPSSVIRANVTAMSDEYNFAALLNEVFGVHANALVYEGPQELTYLQAKQALSSRATLRALQLRVAGNSPFSNFKGK